VLLLLGLLALPSQAAPARVDLAGDAERRVVVDRRAGQYLGHPTTVLLRDGRTILAAYPTGHGRGAIVLKRSTDGGRTWSDRLPVPESFATSLETPTLHRVPGSDGRDRLLLFSGLHPVRLSTSDDEGVSWSELAPVGAWGGIVTMASLELVEGGDLVAFFHDDGRFLRQGGTAEGTFTLLATRSRDGGRTWSEPSTLLARGDLHLCEPGSVRAPDGGELTLLLRENHRTGPSYAIRSRDSGASWSEPVPLAAALTGDRHVARYAPDGRLVVTFRDQAREFETHGDWVAWVGRYADLAARGAGELRVRLADDVAGSDCGYAGLECLPGGTFVAVSYGHWTKGEAPYVIAVRFSLAELDARAR
jgi:hypothetical protein